MSEIRMFFVNIFLLKILLKWAYGEGIGSCSEVVNAWVKTCNCWGVVCVEFSEVLCGVLLPALRGVALLIYKIIISLVMGFLQFQSLMLPQFYVHLQHNCLMLEKPPQHPIGTLLRIRIPMKQQLFALKLLVTKLKSYTLLPRSLKITSAPKTGP